MCIWGVLQGCIVESWQLCPAVTNVLFPLFFSFNFLCTPSSAPGLFGHSAQSLHPKLVTSITPDTNHRKPPSHKTLPLICFQFQCLSAEPPLDTCPSHLLPSSTEKCKQFIINIGILIFSLFFFFFKSVNTHQALSVIHMCRVHIILHTLANTSINGYHSYQSALASDSKAESTSKGKATSAAKQLYLLAISVKEGACEVGDRMLWPRFFNSWEKKKTDKVQIPHLAINI